MGARLLDAAAGLDDEVGALFLLLVRQLAGEQLVELVAGHARALHHSRPLHVGRSFIVVQTDLADADGRRVAQVTQTQAVLGS